MLYRVQHAMSRIQTCVNHLVKMVYWTIINDTYIKIYLYKKVSQVILWHISIKCYQWNLIIKKEKVYISQKLLKVPLYFQNGSHDPVSTIWHYGVKRHFQQYFSYIVAVSFIGWENRSTPGRKPPTCHKSLTNFIT
jgi:hypothetical protein